MSKTKPTIREIRLLDFPTPDISIDITNPLSKPFRKGLDFRLTYSTSLDDFKKTYNESLPSHKGRMREGAFSVAKILISTMAQQMDFMRVHCPDRYLYYLSDSIDSFPVIVNHGMIRTKLGQSYQALSTISAKINILMAAGIIVRKKNTTKRLQAMYESMKQNEEIEEAKNGRGDFILFINKKALTFNYDFQYLVDNIKDVDKLDQDNKPSKKLQKTNYQPISETKSRNSKQNYKSYNETIIINNNAVGNVDEMSKSMKYLTSKLSIDKSNNDKSETSMKGGGDGKGSNISPTPNTVSKPLNQEVISSETSYREKFQRDFFIQKGLPKKNLDYFATLLFYQIREQIYPQYSDFYLEEVETHTKNLLRLHISRIQNNQASKNEKETLEIAFQASVSSDIGKSSSCPSLICLTISAIFSKYSS